MLFFACHSSVEAAMKKGLLLSVQVVLLFGIVARGQDFFPIDSYELSPVSEDYFTREETSRHDDDDDYYRDDSREDDYPSYHDLRENDALHDGPSRMSDRKQKRQDYFDGLAKKVHSPSRKDHHLDLVAGASDPRFRSDRTKRARLSDYDLYYPKRQVKDEDLRSSTQPPSSDFNFDDFLFTTSTPNFDSDRPTSGLNRQKKTPNHYEATRRPSSKSESYNKPSHSVEPRRPMPVFKDDSYNKHSYSVEPRMPMPGFKDDSFDNLPYLVQPRRLTSGFKDDSYDKLPYSVQPHRSTSGFNDDSYSKPSHSFEPRRPSSGFTYQGESLGAMSYNEPRRPSPEFKADSYPRKPSSSAKPHRPSSGFTYQQESLGEIPYDEPLRPSSEFKADSYGKPSHLNEPRRPSSEFDFHTDSFAPINKRPLQEGYSSDFGSKDGPSSEFSYPTESYPNLSSTESFYKKPATRKIRQRSKRIEVDPPLSHTLRSKPEKSDPLDEFFGMPKSKNPSSRSARRPMRVKSSSSRKSPDVHGRSALYDDDFPSKPMVVSFKKDRRRPGIFTEENRHYLAATGYGKPVREQFHEQGTTGPHSYKFGYNTGDKDNPMARYEERSPDGLVKGSYSYVDPLGKLKVVHYESHPDHGFKTTL